MASGVAAPVSADIRCETCKEPIHHERGQGWLHTRTNERQCSPRCDKCGKPATRRTGYHGFDGSGSRFIVTGHVCDAHAPAGAVEWT